MTSINKYDRMSFERAHQDPISAIDTVSLRLKSKETGYQAAVRSELAMLLKASNSIGDSFEKFQELIEVDCLQKKKYRDLDKSNFQEKVIECVVRRGLHGSAISPSCFTKYTGVVRICAAKKIEPEKAAAWIKKKGIENLYKLTARPRVNKKLPAEDHSTKIQDDDQLHIDLKRSVLNKFLEAGEGKRYMLIIESGQRAEDKYLEWKLVEYTDYDDPDNDNDPSKDSDAA